MGIDHIQVDRSGERHLQYYRTGSAASALSLTDLAASVLDTGDIFYTSGVTSALSESTADRSALERSHSLGRFTAYDPNVRPRLWTEASAAAHYKSVLPYVSHLFLSELEALILAKSLALTDIADSAPKDPKDVAGLVAEACFRAGIAEIVIRFDAAGALLATSHAPQPLHVKAWKCRSVDSTGAGDSFNGAYLTSRCMRVLTHSKRRRGPWPPLVHKVPFA